MTDEELAYRQLQRSVDRTCSLILNEGCSEAQIQRARSHARRHAEREFPGSSRLFDLIYESRFERLRQQFRSAD